MQKRENDYCIFSEDRVTKHAIQNSISFFRESSNRIGG